MTHETSMEREGRVFRTTYEGAVDADEIVAAIGEQAACARTCPTLRVITFDYTNASMEPVDADGSRRCAEASARLLTEFPDLVMVGVVPSDLDYGLARMFQTRVALAPEAIDVSRVSLVRDRTGLERILGEILAGSTGPGSPQPSLSEGTAGVW